MKIKSYSLFLFVLVITSSCLFSCKNALEISSRKYNKGFYVNVLSHFAKTKSLEQKFEEEKSIVKKFPPIINEDKILMNNSYIPNNITTSLAVNPDFLKKGDFGSHKSPLKNKKVLSYRDLKKENNFNDQAKPETIQKEKINWLNILSIISFVLAGVMILLGINLPHSSNIFHRYSPMEIFIEDMVGAYLPIFFFVGLILAYISRSVFLKNALNKDNSWLFKRFAKASFLVFGLLMLLLLIIESTILLDLIPWLSFLEVTIAVYAPIFFVAGLVFGILSRRAYKKLQQKLEPTTDTNKQFPSYPIWLGLILILLFLLFLSALSGIGH